MAAYELDNIYEVQIKKDFSSEGLIDVGAMGFEFMIAIDQPIDDEKYLFSGSTRTHDGQDYSMQFQECNETDTKTVAMTKFLESQTTRGHFKQFFCLSPD